MNKKTRSLSVVFNFVAGLLEKVKLNFTALNLLKRRSCDCQDADNRYINGSFFLADAS